ncbi:hypothetical protein CPB85DRAFT_1440455 [Mucidula mucida]|nr:hypothetical protein CPB85DRAFT_1440455 [Mucidula mucida]
MKFSATFAALASTFVASSSAFTINFQNSCSYSTLAFLVMHAHGRLNILVSSRLGCHRKAPNGQPDTSVSTVSNWVLARRRPTVSTTTLWASALGTYGCDGNGANCATGGCNGGLVCNDAGITSGVILSEYGYGDFGQYGGQRTSWDLSRVDSSVNIPTTLTSSDGQSVTCASSSCADDQAYSYATDYAADRNSALGQTFTHKFC